MPAKHKPKAAAKRGPGKPAHWPSEQQRKTVAAMASYGVPEHDIAGVIGIDPKTLRKHYRADLDFAMTKANALVAQSLFAKATGNGNQAVTAAIFWAKTRMGWKETQHLEHTGKDGGAIAIKRIERVIIDPKPK